MAEVLEYYRTVRGRVSFRKSGRGVEVIVENNQDEQVLSFRDHDFGKILKGRDGMGEVQYKEKNE